MLRRSLFMFSNRNLVLLIIFSLINYSCYSYYEISQDNIQKKKPDDEIKIELKNKTEMEVKVKDMNFSAQDSMLAIIQKKGKKLIHLSDIKQFSEPKFDLGVTIAGIITGTIVTLIGLGLLMYILFPHLSMGG